MKRITHYFNDVCYLCYACDTLLTLILHESFPDRNKICRYAHSQLVIAEIQPGNLCRNTRSFYSYCNDKNSQCGIKKKRIYQHAATRPPKYLCPVWQWNRFPSKTFYFRSTGCLNTYELYMVAERGSPSLPFLEGSPCRTYQV